MSKAKILYGVCGIGLGHTFRQLPIIEHFVCSSRMVIFAYGESLKFYASRFDNHRSVTVVPVSVPFVVGGDNGLDFAATAARQSNRSADDLTVNCAAMAMSRSLLGKPDLVVSDYEPISAQYAYALDAPLVTIDQQSKYLVGEFPRRLGGCGYQDEVERLRMFFPRAEARLACSFFRVTPKADARERVRLFPPVLKPEIANMRRNPVRERPAVLVYISSQREFVQEISSVLEACAANPDAVFHVFLPRASGVSSTAQNIALYEHGDQRFTRVLQECNGLVTTGGHGLLSEAMHLGIPAYVIPLAVYEQQMNAHVIDKHRFGVSRARVDGAELRRFIDKLPQYAANIKDDREILQKGSGEKRIIAHLERYL
jgi:uncharacterized protein (TIGR00661 family)